MFELRKYREVIFHDAKEWCKIWRKSDLWFGKWHEEFGKFSPEHMKVSKFGLLLGPFIQSRKNVWAWNLQGCYVLWKWRIIQNLKRNWLVYSILKWGIWQILTEALKKLKKLHFNGLLLTKAYNVWAKESTEELFLIALKIDTKDEGKLTCTF